MRKTNFIIVKGNLTATREYLLSVFFEELNCTPDENYGATIVNMYDKTFWSINPKLIDQSIKKIEALKGATHQQVQSEYFIEEHKLTQIPVEYEKL